MSEIGTDVGAKIHGSLEGAISITQQDAELLPFKFVTAKSNIPS